MKHNGEQNQEYSNPSRSPEIHKAKINIKTYKARKITKEKSDLTSEYVILCLECQESEILGSKHPCVMKIDI